MNIYNLLGTYLLLISLVLFQFNNDNSKVNKKKQTVETLLLNKLNIKRVNIIAKRKVKIAVLDTGINKYSKVYDYIKNKNTKPSSFPSNHGTHISGIISLLNKNADLYHYNFYKGKLASIDGSSSKSKDWVKNLKNVLEVGFDVVNISSSGDLYIQEEYELMKKYKNTIFVVASGNEGQNLKNFKSYPAGYNLPNIISVANYKSFNSINTSSNYGNVFVGTIGTNIPSYCSIDYCHMTGSSQSTAIMSAFIAHMLSKKEMNALNIKREIRKYSQKDSFTKAGFFNYNKFITDVL